MSAPCGERRRFQQQAQNLRIKEGRDAVKWTRLSCCFFAANAVCLHLHALASNLGIFCARWPRPTRLKIDLRRRSRKKPIKIAAKVVGHVRDAAS
jgi:hypothetical protein